MVDVLASFAFAASELARKKVLQGMKSNKINEDKINLLSPFVITPYLQSSSRFPSDRSPPCFLKTSQR